MGRIPAEPITVSIKNPRRRRHPLGQTPAQGGPASRSTPDVTLHWTNPSTSPGSALLTETTIYPPQLHHWVWAAAAARWRHGHYRHAVPAAARWRHGHYRHAVPAAAIIRNWAAHTTGPVDPQVALEYSAALSILARWIREGSLRPREPRNAVTASALIPVQESPSPRLRWEGFRRGWIRVYSWQGIAITGVVSLGAEYVPPWRLGATFELALLPLGVIVGFGLREISVLRTGPAGDTDAGRAGAVFGLAGSGYRRGGCVRPAGAQRPSRGTCQPPFRFSDSGALRYGACVDGAAPVPRSRGRQYLG